MIYHCWASLEKSIRTDEGGGFTNYLDQYVEATDAPEAAEAYREHLEKQGLCVRRTDARVAPLQDRASYDSPDDILVARVPTHGAHALSKTGVLTRNANVESSTFK